MRRLSWLQCLAMAVVAQVDVVAGAPAASAEGGLLSCGRINPEGQNTWTSGGVGHFAFHVVVATWCATHSPDAQRCVGAGF